MKVTTVRLPDELHRRLHDAAYDRGYSKNDLVLEALNAFLRRKDFTATIANAQADVAAIASTPGDPAEKAIQVAERTILAAQLDAVDVLKQAHARLTELSTPHALPSIDELLAPASTEIEFDALMAAGEVES